MRGYKNLFSVLLVSIFLCGDGYAQEKCKTYVEAIDPDTTDYAWQWAEVKGMQVSFGDINKRYSKSTTPNIKATKEWTTTAWKGEKTAATLLVWTSQDIEEAQCSFSNFIGSGGTILSKNLSSINKICSIGHFYRYHILLKASSAVSCRL